MDLNKKFKTNKQLLEHFYKENLRSPAAFTSVEPLLREIRQVNKRITRREVQNFLASQDVYTLHRRAVRKYKRMPTLAPGLHTEWQADLSIMDRLSKVNKGYKYFLVCIDTFSRQLFVEPVKSKHSANMIDAFKRLFKRSKVIPWKLLTDQGLEFNAKPVEKYFRSLDMEHFCMLTSPQFHAGMAERANRSIKERLYRYFTARRTQKWIDIIQDLVYAINHSFNSSIGMRPVDVTYKNADELRERLKQAALLKHASASKAHQFRVGDHVRIEKHKHVFQKGYMPNFTSEIFIIDRVRRTPYQPATYRIRDQNGEPIKGWFYNSDFCLVLPADTHEKDAVYDIERVLRKQKKDGVEMFYVKWKGYGTEHNSWIPANSIIWK